MRFIQQALFGKKADPSELDALRSYFASEVKLAASQTRATEDFVAGVTRSGMKVLSGEADKATRRDMEDVAARYSERLVAIQQKHAALRAPEAAADYYAARQLVYIQHLKWSKAQEAVYQTQGDAHAGNILIEANKQLATDKRSADKVRNKLVRYIGLSRHDVNQMMQDATASPGDGLD